MCLLGSVFATQELAVWFMDSRFRLQLSYQIWKEKYKGASLLKNSMKYAGTAWILKWRPILRAYGPRDAKEGFLFLKGDYVNARDGGLNNSRGVFCV